MNPRSERWGSRPRADVPRDPGGHPASASPRKPAIEIRRINDETVRSADTGSVEQTTKFAPPHPEELSTPAARRPEAAFANEATTVALTDTPNARNSADAALKDHSPASIAERSAGTSTQNVLKPVPRLMEPAPQPDATSDVAGGIEENPRIVIGRINVEVIPPAAEVKTVESRPPRPITAESVSVIGSLARGIRENRRLHLRYR